MQWTNLHVELPKVMDETHFQQKTLFVQNLWTELLVSHLESNLCYKNAKKRSEDFVVQQFFNHETTRTAYVTRNYLTLIEIDIMKCFHW